MRCPVPPGVSRRAPCARALKLVIDFVKKGNCFVAGVVDEQVLLLLLAPFGLSKSTTGEKKGMVAIPFG
jgi:hypothetical protein